ncbi:MAG: hypothetical protein ACP5DZ_04280, partial [Bacteroidales bacterium]
QELAIKMNLGITLSNHKILILKENDNSGYHTVSLPVPDCLQAGLRRSFCKDGPCPAVNLSVFILLRRTPPRRNVVKTESEDGNNLVKLDN